MKSVLTLIKIHENKINDLQIEYGLIDQQRLGFIAEKNTLEAEMNQEIIDHRFSNCAFALENYLKKAKEKLSMIDQNISDSNHRLISIKIKIHKEFTELKRFEIIQEKRQEEIRKSNARIEAKNLDEITMMQTFNKNKL